MRETKDQTIIRLKREVAELKEAVRGQKRMAKEKIKESKETLIQSQSKSKADLREGKHIHRERTCAAYCGNHEHFYRGNRSGIPPNPDARKETGGDAG